MIIAVDGPAASGKGTLAKRIAELLGLPVLDEVVRRFAAVEERS